LFNCAAKGLTTSNCIKHITLNPYVTLSPNSYNQMVDHVWVYTFMYASIFRTQSANRNIIWKIAGNPRATGSTGTLTVTQYFTYSTDNNVYIRSIVSLE